MREVKPEHQGTENEKENHTGHSSYGAFKCSGLQLQLGRRFTAAKQNHSSGAAEQLDNHNEPLLI